MRTYYVRNQLTTHMSDLGMMEVEISKSDCLIKLKEFIDETDYMVGRKQKLNSFEVLREILSKFRVSITEKPIEKVRNNTM